MRIRASFRQWGVVLLFILITFAITLTRPFVLFGDDGKLPSAHDLIREVQAIFKRDEKPDSWVLSELAAAHAHLGDFAKGRELLTSVDPDFLIAGAFAMITDVEIAQTGTASPLPADLNRDLPGWTDLIPAEMCAKHGYADKALEHIRALPIGRGSILKDLAANVIEPLNAGGHRDAAREVLLLWIGCFAGAKTTFDYQPRENIGHLVGLLSDLGEKEKAIAFCEGWQDVMASDKDLDEHGHYIGRGWANLALAWFRVGDKGKAEEALKQSRIWLDKARIAEEDPNLPHELIHYAKVYASLAAKIEAVMGVDAARETYDLAYQAALLAVPSKYEHYGYEEIAEAQLENDDPEAAIRTAERVQHPRSKAMCWQRISDHSRKQRNLVAAKYSARQAAQLLLINDFRPFIARDMARVAATVAQAGEVELAKQVFERAIAFSNANDDPKFDHHWIARMQVSGGLLTDAYGTIQAITDANDRALPLAQLARAVAKAEFEASKKNKK